MLSNIPIEGWNNSLTLIVSLATLALICVQIKYYMNQRSSLNIEGVADAEHHDFEQYTKYEWTTRVQNSGRDPLSIVDAELSINGETIDVTNREDQSRITTTGRGTNPPTFEFETLRLGSNELEDIELYGKGQAVDTTESLTGEFWLETSVGNTQHDIEFERAS